MWYALGFGTILASILYATFRVYWTHRKRSMRLKAGLPAEGSLNPHIYDPTKRGAWLASFWEMHAAPGGTDRCLYVHACWPCAAGDVAKRVGLYYTWDCLLGGLIGMLLTSTYFVCFGYTRSVLRGKFDIPGNLLMDSIATCLFPCCFLAQSLNHLDLAEGITASPPSFQLAMQCKFGKAAAAAFAATQAAASAAASGASAGGDHSVTAVGAGKDALGIPVASPPEETQRQQQQQGQQQEVMQGQQQDILQDQVTLNPLGGP